MVDHLPTCGATLGRLASAAGPSHPGSRSPRPLADPPTALTAAPAHPSTRPRPAPRRPRLPRPSRPRQRPTRAKSWPAPRAKRPRDARPLSGPHCTPTATGAKDATAGASRAAASAAQWGGRLYFTATGDRLLAAFIRLVLPPPRQSRSRRRPQPRASHPHRYLPSTAIPTMPAQSAPNMLARRRAAVCLLAPASGTWSQSAATSTGKSTSSMEKPR